MSPDFTACLKDRTRHHAYSHLKSLPEIILLHVPYKKQVLLQRTANYKKTRAKIGKGVCNHCQNWSAYTSDQLRQPS